MNSKLYLSKQWVTVGASSGMIANLLFPFLLLVSLPASVEIFLTGMFGVCFSICGFGIHHLLKYEKPSIFTQIAALFVFVSGFLFNLMLMVQQVFRGYIHQFKTEAISVEENQLLDLITKTVDPIHLSMQLSNDFFCAIAMLLFSFVMYRHSGFGKLWSSTGITISITLLIIKCYAFPFTPQEIGIPFIIGALIAIWFLAVCVQCLRKRNLIPHEDSFEIFV